MPGCQGCIGCWDAVARMFRSRTVTHVNCQGLPINSHHSYSQILHWLKINEQIKYNIYLCVLQSFNSVLCAAFCGFLADPKKLVMQYTVRTWLYNVLKLKKTYSYNFFQRFQVVIYSVLQFSGIPARWLPARYNTTKPPPIDIG